jgi:hypothetical protein
VKLFILAAMLVALFAIGGVSAKGAHAATQSGTITLDQASPALGQYVTFTTTTTGLKGNQNPRIEIDCYQSGVLVFASAAPSNQPQQLGGAGSQWLTNGGPADCTATLYYWDFHPVETFVPLASTSFAAGG